MTVESHERDGSSPEMPSFGAPICRVSRLSRPSGLESTHRVDDAGAAHNHALKFAVVRHPHCDVEILCDMLVATVLPATVS
jgi:hypothetical protein